MKNILGGLSFGIALGFIYVGAHLIHPGLGLMVMGAILLAAVWGTVHKA